jgi:hypothetical protein
MRAGLQRIDHREGGHDFAGGVHGDLELAAGQRLDGFGHLHGAAEDGVQGLGEAGGEAPAHGGLRVHRGGDAGGQHAGDAGALDDGTTVHGWNSCLVRAMMSLVHAWKACRRLAAFCRHPVCTYITALTPTY